MSSFLSEKDAKNALFGALQDLGIPEGSVIYLGVDMSGLPLPHYKAELTKEGMKARQHKWCSFIVEALLEYLGEKGTLLAPAFSYSCSAKGSTFILEETASQIGPLPEYIRCHPKAVRSLHPMFSVSGIGQFANEILLNTGKSAFGARSVFANLNNYDCIFVCLGTIVSNMMTYIHHLEQTYGCNHRYNKVFDVTVIRNGERVEGPWLAYMAYRSIASSMQCKSLEEKLREEKVLKETAINKKPFQAVHIADLNLIGYQMLESNPCSFMHSNVIVDLDESESMKSPASGSRVILEVHHAK